MFRTMIIIMLCASGFVHAAEQKCLVAGEAIHWQADYCMYKIGTDDFFHEGVQECMQKKGKKLQKSSCAAKVDYKKKICEMVADAKPYNGSVGKCFQDSEFAGPTVRNGGV